MCILCLLALPIWAQTTDSIQTDSVLVPVPQTLNAQATVDIYQTDEKINDGFASFGDPVSNFIFYAPKIGEDMLFGKVGEARMEKDFYAKPPLTVSYIYADADAVSFDKAYTVAKGAEGGMTLSYEKEADIKPGVPFTINGDTYTVVIKGDGKAVDLQKEGFPIELTYTGDATFAQSLAFSTQPLSGDEALGSLPELKLTYTQTDPIPADGQIEADGYSFKIAPNAESAYKLDGASAYTFMMSEVSFLPIVVIVLLAGALFFTFFFGFVNFRKFKLAIDVVRGKYTDPTEKGEVSHFQALTAALSGTVGLGNIAGVAIAISIGGAGATFWMILAGLLGMSSKFVECTLGVKYRTIDADGEVSGGPMYYLSRGLAEKGMANLGKIFAAFFAIMCIGGSFGGGNMFQVNQAFQQFAGLEFIQNTWIADNGWMFGVIMAALVAVVIIGGIRSIANVTDKIVPFMCGLYVLAALIIIGLNIGDLPRVFGEIFAGAFAPTAVAGGFIGVLIQGFRRAAFSNEAGVGSASIAHAAVKTN
ncbi:MAG: alanine:cation symporter family protein, partial [Bacteroidota bacterium]